MTFEIRTPSGEVKLTFPLPDGGYPEDVLRKIEADGYLIYADQKRKKALMQNQSCLWD